jgi:hypothetical protein
MLLFVYSSMINEISVTTYSLFISPASALSKLEKRIEERAGGEEDSGFVFVEAADGWEHRGMPQHCRVQEGGAKPGRQGNAIPASCCRRRQPFYTYEDRGFITSVFEFA